MFNKILIANRGEIACRVIKTAKRLGIRTVAVYSDADQYALHVKQADEAVHIGAAPSAESYLLGDRIIAAAKKTGAQAIHPGYGFLSENAGFAQACADNELVFIGPPIAAIQAMGSKSAAKNIMGEAEVPLVPGYHGADQDPALIKQSADQMGYPVLLKAVAGGGGKGMRQVWSEDEFEQALADAKRESMASFGDSDMLVEKYLTQPRHVEFQVFCDSHGNGVYLFERDCSVQRRHQKIIEEAPAPNMSEALRKDMGDTAVRAAQAINYQGAGTVEFLLDVDGSFYFMEMNTRLQVEHPVTEMITGEDLVEWQLRVANGECLPKQQNELSIRGHSFEARVYAEDPNNDFLPTSGTLETLRTPTESEYVRVDTGVIEGDEVSPFYDPMIAKLIVWDEDRATALSRTAKALRDYQISGVTTNLNFLYDLATSEPFVNAEIDTGFIEKHYDKLFNPVKTDLPVLLSQAALYLVLTERHTAGTDPWAAKNGWRANQANVFRYELDVSGDTHPVTVELLNTGSAFLVSIKNNIIEASAVLIGQALTATLGGHCQSVTIAKNGNSHVVFGEHGASQFTVITPDLGDQEVSQTDNNFTAPMNGTIVEVLVKAGDTVKQNQSLIIVEAMKMQHTMTASSAGTVTGVYFESGDLVDGGAVLLDFEADENQDNNNDLKAK
ncbi:MAG: 3-methylcrotonyl-CoA carboxylase alpha subunit [Arenicella sp.]|jgi:3-methylcrotonyl-CoA carboxylase alpha subunit